MGFSFSAFVCCSCIGLLWNRASYFPTVWRCILLVYKLGFITCFFKFTFYTPGPVSKLCEQACGFATQGITNTARLNQNGLSFPENIFKCIFFNESIKLSINIPLKFAPNKQYSSNGSDNDWHRLGDQPSPQPMVVNLLMHIFTTLPLELMPFGLRWTKPGYKSNIMTGSNRHYITVTCRGAW